MATDRNTKRTRKAKKTPSLSYGYLCGLLVFFVSMFFGPSLDLSEVGEDNVYLVYVNDTYVGSVEDEQTANACFQTAKEQIVSASDEMTFISADLTLEGTYQVLGTMTDTEEMTQAMTEILSDCVVETLERAYMLKINSYMAALSSVSEVEDVLQQVVDYYNLGGDFDVSIQIDSDRGFMVLTATIGEVTDEEGGTVDRNVAGLTTLEDGLFDEESYETEQTADDYELGVLGMYFMDRIEIAECYLSPDSISTVDEVVAYLLNDELENEIYTVQSGDTLSGIALSTGVPMEDLIAMNDSLESESLIIRIDQELIITVPTSSLTVAYVATEFIAEEYEAETEYIYNDNWYTTESETLQDPSAGYREIVANVTYLNGEASEEEILYENVLMEAVPKIVEKGTKTPPAYIKPVYGGTLSSGFGSRWGTVHKGVDWAVPVGTTVYASSGGTVTRAGWSSSYGYCIYIQHPDGKETRYAHCSKLYVSVGDTVVQGQAIALSGNTGRSTGPHLHFEIRVNGVAVNPLLYVSS
ncbi:MAG: peptidoglycan DD-metalloendopeptidase family protein [Lachnospiraceae bacterium]|nr:peptidoglycan DD-metalloendopeptidase family protein [Lachnospiraceae bacterium]